MIGLELRDSKWGGLKMGSDNQIVELSIWPSEIFVKFKNVKNPFVDV